MFFWSVNTEYLIYTLRLLFYSVFKKKIYLILHETGQS